MIRCIAVDDEPRALEVIRSHVSRIDDVELLGSFVDPAQAVAFLQGNRVDVVFLDINMREFNGVQLAEQLPELIGNDSHPPLIVFTTAHSQYAVKSYDVAAVDYLLKPFDLARFLHAINRVKVRLDTNSSDKADYFFVDVGGQKVRVVFGDLLYVEGQGNYVEYVTPTDRHLVRSSMRETMNLLAGRSFVQIHRSFIVNIHKIDRVESSRVFVGGRKLSIGTTYRQKFKDFFGGR